MLILSRKDKQSFLLYVKDGNNKETEIEIVVVKSGKGRSSIGFVAPNNVRIIRSELRNTPKP